MIKTIQINLLNKCTSRCMTCRKYTWPDDHIDYDVLKRTIEFLHKQGLTSICFSGGEPLMYYKIKELVNLCYDLGIKFSFITTAIVNPDLFKFIVSKANRLHISIDSNDPNTYKFIRGVDGLDVVKRNIKLVSGDHKNCEIRISTTISNLNYNEFDELFDFAKENDCLINFYMVHEHDEFFLNEDQKKVMYDKLRKISEMDTDGISNAHIITNEKESYNHVHDDFDCVIPHYHCLINANGDIYPCCKLLNDNGEYGDQIKYVYGNINNEDLEKEFEKRFDNKYYALSYCNGCEERYISRLEDVKKGIVKDFL